jgi:allantoicase
MRQSADAKLCSNTRSVLMGRETNKRTQQKHNFTSRLVEKSDPIGHVKFYKNYRALAKDKLARSPGENGGG